MSYSILFQVLCTVLKLLSPNNAYYWRVEIVYSKIIKVNVIFCANLVQLCTWTGDNTVPFTSRLQNLFTCFMLRYNFSTLNSLGYLNRKLIFVYSLLNIFLFGV